MTHLKRYLKIISSLLLLISTHTPLSLAQPTPARTPEKKQPASNNLSSVVGLNELKLEMAQSRFKLSKSPKAINDLVNALEEYLSTNCMGKVLQNLTYNGSPTDPTCIERMEQLLEINRDNPVAICVRDGIGAKSCIDAYRDQKIEPVYESSNEGDLDPALKVGLSAATIERLGKIEQSLNEVNSKYQSATSPEEKRDFIKDAATLYDQALGMACRISAVSVKQGESGGTEVEPIELAQARERLLQIPPAIRKDYQAEMEKKALEEMAKDSTSNERKEELKGLLKIIHDPTGISEQLLSSMQRSRRILERCATTLDLAKRVVPDLPAVTCYREGWYTPQCIAALKKWRTLKQQEGANRNGSLGSQTPVSSIISKF